MRTGLYDQHPFPGFDVIAHGYPNHPGAEAPRLDAHGVASALMLKIVDDWLRPDPDVAAWEISEPDEGEGDHSGEYTIHLGPFDEKSDAFIDPILIVARETAGGGLMVLLSHDGRPHAGRIGRYAASVLDRRESGEAS